MDYRNLFSTAVAVLFEKHARYGAAWRWLGRKAFAFLLLKKALYIKSNALSKQETAYELAAVINYGLLAQLNLYHRPAATDLLQELIFPLTTEQLTDWLSERLEKQYALLNKKESDYLSLAHVFTLDCFIDFILMKLHRILSLIQVTPEEDITPLIAEYEDIVNYAVLALQCISSAADRFSLSPTPPLQS
jgi:hypothetical protein